MAQVPVSSIRIGDHTHHRRGHLVLKIEYVGVAAKAVPDARRPVRRQSSHSLGWPTGECNPAHARSRLRRREALEAVIRFKQSSPEEREEARIRPLCRRGQGPFRSRCSVEACLAAPFWTTQGGTEATRDSCCGGHATGLPLAHPMPEHRVNYEPAHRFQKARGERRPPLRRHPTLRAELTPLPVSCADMLVGGSGSAVHYADQSAPRTQERKNTLPKRARRICGRPTGRPSDLCCPPSARARSERLITEPYEPPSHGTYALSWRSRGKPYSRGLRGGGSSLLRTGLPYPFPW